MVETEKPMQKLYKFMSINANNYASIGNSSLWFSDVRKFNDPFEGLFALKMPTFDEVKINDLRRLSSRYVEIVRQAGIQDATDLPKGLSKQQYHDYLSPHFKSILAGIRNHFIERMGVSCFVRDLYIKDEALQFLGSDRAALHNQLMWSHYADGLRGLCIEFDGETLYDGLKHLNPSHEIAPVEIKYTDIRPRIDVWEAISKYIQANESMRIQLTEQWLDETSKKPIQWEYENEIRFRALDAVDQNLKYPSEAISKVVFGQKMPEVHRIALRRLFGSLGVPAESFHEICIDELHYKLNMNPVKDI